jgi:hypothetical protein
LIVGPDLPRVVAAFNAERARHVVIGGFAVVAHQYVRATEDVDLLVPDEPANDERVVAALARLGARMRDGRAIEPSDVATREHLRVDSDAGIVDLLRAGVAPLDFDSVDADAIEAVVDDVPIRVCGLASLVAFKRLANRSRDRLDLEELEARYGRPLPRLHLPGLDDHVS